MIVFLGAAVSSVYNAIPNYRNIAFIIVGVVSVFLYLFVSASNLLLLAIILGMAHLLDFLYLMRKRKIGTN